MSFQAWGSHGVGLVSLEFRSTSDLEKEDDDSDNVVDITKAVLTMPGGQSYELDDVTWPEDINIHTSRKSVRSDAEDDVEEAQYTEVPEPPKTKRK